VSTRVALTPGRRAGLWTTWWLAVGGVVAGAAWLLLAPRAKIQIASDGSGYYVDPSPREYIQADLLYAGLCLVVAVVAAVAARRFVRAHPVEAVAGLAVGGELAALITWQVGKIFAPLDRTAAQHVKPGTIVLDALDLGAKGLLLLLPVAALATWLAIDLVTARGLDARPVLDEDPPPDAQSVPEEDPVPDPELTGDVQSQPPPPTSA
jgi:hypothetical protein